MRTNVAIIDPITIDTTFKVADHVDKYVAVDVEDSVERLVDVAGWENPPSEDKLVTGADGKKKYLRQGIRVTFGFYNEETKRIDQEITTIVFEESNLFKTIVDTPRITEGIVPGRILSGESASGYTWYGFHTAGHPDVELASLNMVIAALNRMRQA